MDLAVGGDLVESVRARVGDEDLTTGHQQAVGVGVGELRFEAQVGAGPDEVVVTDIGCGDKCPVPRPPELRDVF